MLSLQIALPLLLSSSLGLGQAAYDGFDALDECPQSSTGVYDYIVVGSEHGFSVLVIETGVDESKNINTTTLALNFDATDDPKIDLNYTIREYPSDFRIQRNDVWYPRAAGIGGCTHLRSAASRAHSYRVYAAYRFTTQWTTASGDFVKHSTKLADGSTIAPGPGICRNTSRCWSGIMGGILSHNSPFQKHNEALLNPQWEPVGNAAIAAAGPLIEDINSHLPSRTSLADSTLGPLTRISRDLQSGIGKSKDIVAQGVSVAFGAKLPIAQVSTGKKTSKEKNIFARREVIVSAGTFQSPQLLMVYALWHRRLRPTQEVGIPTVVDLPGVGSNLQGNEEIRVFWELQQNFTDPVSFGEVFSTSANATTLEPDIDTYFVSKEFPGFVHGLSVITASTPNFLTIVNLKAEKIPSKMGR
ncbi:choline dehydrogenase [Favolaschia claudopus]|uniref:Choline dehydrogenase n=1 Tax=Favolaschia claudopus TaxID=2862362 RepID=A0AAW0CV06_9AGAR